MTESTTREDATGIVVLYDSWADAQATVQELLDNGFGRDRINIVTKESAGQTTSLGKTKESTMFDGGVGGMVAGGIAGGILAGLAGLVLPGIGTVLVGGPLFAAFFGANAGAVAGGLIGAFADWNIRDNDAQYYAEGVLRGGTLIAVQTDSSSQDRAVEIIDHYRPVDMETRVAQWRTEGWTKFDPEGKADAPTIREGAQSDLPHQLGGEDSSLRAGKLPGIEPFESFMADFRQHFQTTYGSKGGSYEDYLPAYRYGYNLANDERYADKGWAVVEPDLRDYWETYQPGMWDKFVDAVHFARDKVRERH